MLGIETQPSPQRYNVVNFLHRRPNMSAVGLPQAETHKPLCGSCRARRSQCAQQCGDAGRTACKRRDLGGSWRASDPVRLRLRRHGCEKLEAVMGMMDGLRGVGSIAGPRAVATSAGVTRGSLDGHGTDAASSSSSSSEIVMLPNICPLSVKTPSWRDGDEDEHAGRMGRPAPSQ